MKYYLMYDADGCGYDTNYLTLKDPDEYFVYGRSVSLDTRNKDEKGLCSIQDALKIKAKHPETNIYINE